MAFDPTIFPFLTPINVSDDTSYGAPFSSQLTGNSDYNTNISWSGPGGTLEIQTSGNLQQIAAINTTGLVGIVVPGVEVAAIQLTGGTGISSVLTGTDFVISVVNSTSIQWIRGQADGVSVGQPRDTINLIAGDGISIESDDTGQELEWTISASPGSGITAPFITYTTNSDLTNAQNIGLLTSGLLKNTVASGIATLSTAIPGTDYLVPSANLNAISALSPQNGDLLAYYGSAWNLLAPGSVGQVLTTLSTTSLGWVSNGSGDVTLAGAQTFTGVKTFTPQQIFTNSIQIPLGATAGSILTSDSSGNATWAASGNGDVTLAGPQTFTGIKTFTPQQIFTNSLKIPLGATNGFVLTSDASGNATWVANGNGDATLAGAQTFTGIKTFTPQQVFTNSIKIPLGAVSGYVLTSDASGNMTLAPNTGSFLSSAVSTTDATPTTLATITIASNTAVTFSGTISGRNTSGSINNACGGRFNVVAINTAGTVTLAATADVTVQSTSTATFNVVVSGTNLILTVTGIAATPYNWAASYTTISL